MAEDLTTDIASNASGPKKGVVDGVEIEQHSLPDQIAADRYIKACNASVLPLGGIKRTKLTPPNAGDVNCARLSGPRCCP